jgi:hypothetical protein
LSISRVSSSTELPPNYRWRAAHRFRRRVAEKNNHRV